MIVTRLKWDKLPPSEIGVGGRGKEVWTVQTKSKIMRWIAEVTMNRVMVACTGGLRSRMEGVGRKTL